MNVLILLPIIKLFEDKSIVGGHIPELASELLSRN
jgi:hypothetical protein